ncbi:site-specific integrase [Mucilaginibacter sp. JRF]|uniref:tyrosine-type recombinase/integrase n=1 Tax=Mucilaginibacter sp. JRF TaxID=2780088 RepID=UPI00188114A0|nr:site-specific integrase [Mucilaginibacter sp. JRF]MBE9584632.1 site-specific integrase [Mucilaginibacter sp. JRF]
MHVHPRIILANHEKKQGKFAIKVRICFQRKTTDYKTGLSLTKEEFEKANLPNPPRSHRGIRLKLDTIIAKANDVVANLENFSVQKFKDGFYGAKREAFNVYHIFDEFINMKINEGCYKTSVNYTTALNSFKDFRSKLSFYDVDVTFLNKYHRWMIDIKGNSETTVSIYCRALRAIVNYAISKKYLKSDFDYPFNKYKYQIPGGRKAKKALSALALEAIFNHRPIPYSLEDRAKDFWLLSYMCNGMNVNDIIRLKVSNIDGNMIRYHRGKTFRTSQSNRPLISISLEEEILVILNKWGNLNQEPDDYIFDILEKTDKTEELITKKKELFTDSLNKYFKRVCRNLQFENPKITMIYARHTAATMLKKANVPIFQIQESLGHTKPETTKNYLGDFDDESKVELTKTLTGFTRRA